MYGLELKIFRSHLFFDAFCFFHGREPRIDCMLLTEAASVPRKDFSTSSLEKDEAMRHGRNGSLGVQGGRQNTRLFNAARKLNLRSVIGSLYIKLIIINCLSTRQKDTLYHICLTFQLQPYPVHSSFCSIIPTEIPYQDNLHKAEAACYLLNGLQTGNKFDKFLRPA